MKQSIHGRSFETSWLENFDKKNRFGDNGGHSHSRVSVCFGNSVINTASNDAYFFPALNREETLILWQTSPTKFSLKTFYCGRRKLLPHQPRRSQKQLSGDEAGRARVLSKCWVKHDYTNLYRKHYVASKKKVWAPSYNYERGYCFGNQLNNLQARG